MVETVLLFSRQAWVSHADEFRASNITSRGSQTLDRSASSLCEPPQTLSENSMEFDRVFYAKMLPSPEFGLAVLFLPSVLENRNKNREIVCLFCRKFHGLIP